MRATSSEADFLLGEKFSSSPLLLHTEVRLFQRLPRNFPAPDFAEWDGQSQQGNLSKGKEDQRILGKGVKLAEMKNPGSHFLPGTGAARLVRRSTKMYPLVWRTHSSDDPLPQKAPKQKGLRTRCQWLCCTNKLPASETNIIFIHFSLMGLGLQDQDPLHHALTSGKSSPVEYRRSRLAKPLNFQSSAVSRACFSEWLLLPALQQTLFPHSTRPEKRDLSPETIPEKA